VSTSVVGWLVAVEYLFEILNRWLRWLVAVEYLFEILNSPVSTTRIGNGVAHRCRPATLPPLAAISVRTSTRHMAAMAYRSLGRVNFDYHGIAFPLWHYHYLRLSSPFSHRSIPRLMFKIVFLL